MAEPSHNPAPDETLQYAPGEVTPTPPPAAAPQPVPPPELREVTVNGQTMRVSPDVAAIIDVQNQQLQQAQTRQTQLEQEVQGFQKWRQDMGQAFTGQQQPAQPDYNTLLYTNPTEAFNQFGQQMENRIIESMRSMYQEDQQRQSQERAYNDFMSNFYQAHPQLRSVQTIVDAALQRNYNTWTQQGMTMSQAQDKLAEEVNAEVLNMMQQFGGGQQRGGGGRQNLRLVESGGGGPSGGQQTTGDDVVDGNSLPLGTVQEDIQALRESAKRR